VVGHGQGNPGELGGPCVTGGFVRNVCLGTGNVGDGEGCGVAVGVFEGPGTYGTYGAAADRRGWEWWSRIAVAATASTPATVAAPVRKLSSSIRA
jgi:hypothetical protein